HPVVRGRDEPVDPHRRRCRTGGGGAARVRVRRVSLAHRAWLLGAFGLAALLASIAVAVTIGPSTVGAGEVWAVWRARLAGPPSGLTRIQDRKSTRLNSSHVKI